MADNPVDDGSIGGLYSSDDEPMDTDSEQEHESKAVESEFNNQNHDPDVDSSTRMEISDNEDAGSEPGAAPLPDSSIPANSTTASDSNTAQEAETQPRLVSQMLINEERQVLTTAQSQKANGTHLMLPLRAIEALQQPIYGLTVPLWQNVLSYLPATSLGKLLRTTRIFHAILGPEQAEEIQFQKRFQMDVSFKAPDKIWQMSRTRFEHHLPSPLEGKSELDMLRLLRGTKCQICKQDKVFVYGTSTTDPWHSGPGDTGMRVVWPCAVRICGKCLGERTQQEFALQMSTTFPRNLIQALPPIFLTQFNDWIPEPLLLNQPVPPHVQIRKLFYQPHIDAAFQQFKEVRDLGEAAADEWSKGLEQQRNARVKDANRWATWERQDGFLRPSSSRQSSKPQAPAPMSMPGPVIGPPGAHHHIPPQQAFHPPPQVPQFADHGISQFPMHTQPPSISPAHFQQQPQYGYGQFQQGVPPPQSQPQQHQLGGQVRAKRTLQEVNEARAARRHDIERRCLELDPPIQPKVLTHMQSFQAALQISFPFTDNDWEVLKPRLLAQREAAEAQEAVLTEQLKAIQTTASQPSLEVLLMRDPNDLSEADWESLQAPVHEATSNIADEYIQRNWNGATSISQNTAPGFAADVLLAVRHKYYENMSQNSPNGSPTSKIPLSLEGMKWLYDNKVKSTAELYQKEIFQCSACDSNAKYYGFEGVIQHYAAKHTTALSRNNIIVNWRSEWPDPAPFQSYTSPSQQTTRSDSATGFGGYGQPHQASAYQLPGQSYGTFPQPSSYGNSSGYNALPQEVATAGQESMNGQIPYVTTTAASDLNRQQMVDMAHASRDLWNATMGIKELPASVRIHVLIHHMSAKFEKKHGTSPDIAMFLYGLNENAQMRPIRSLNGLTCKICNAGTFRMPASTDRKKFTLPALVNHFKSAHLGHIMPDETPPDWRIDMVDLPDDPVIESLVASNGMDERKFHLIAEVFPEAFPSPLPSLASLKEARAKTEAARIRLEALRSLDIGTTRPTQSANTIGNSSRPDSRRVSQERLTSRSPYNSDAGPVEPPGEDEYDPSRPFFQGAIVEHPGMPRSAGTQKSNNFSLPPGIVSLGVELHSQPQSPHGQGGYADRLLRHHKGVAQRPVEADYVKRDSYSAQELQSQAYTPVQNTGDASAVDRFLENLAPAIPEQHSREAYAANAHYPAEDPEPRQVQRPVYADAAPRYAYPPAEYRGSTPMEDARYGMRPTERESYHVVPQDRRWEAQPESQAVAAQQHYASRERSRSPRRSLPREYANYDQHMVQASYEERPESRWRGTSPPPRAGYYRTPPEASYVTRPESILGRDAQGRTVRYIAVPVDEYEAQPMRYPPARAPVQEMMPQQQQYMAMAPPGQMMEVDSEGRYYVRGPVRHAGEPIDERYREYR